MNKTGLMAKISIKYVLRQVFGNMLADFAVFRVFGEILRDFAEIPEFRRSATTRNIRSPVLSPVSLTELCSFWYGLKDLFTLHKLAKKVVLDR